MEKGEVIADWWSSSPGWGWRSSDGALNVRRLAAFRLWRRVLKEGLKWLPRNVSGCMAEIKKRMTERRSVDGGHENWIWTC